MSDLSQEEEIKLFSQQVQELSKQQTVTNQKYMNINRQFKNFNDDVKEILNDYEKKLDLKIKEVNNISQEIKKIKSILEEKLNNIPTQPQLSDQSNVTLDSTSKDYIKLKQLILEDLESNYIPPVKKEKSATPKKVKNYIFYFFTLIAISAVVLSSLGMLNFNKSDKTKPVSHQEKENSRPQENKTITIKSYFCQSTSSWKKYNNEIKISKQPNQSKKRVFFTYQNKKCFYINKGN